jgi:hypothetical protein
MEVLAEAAEAVVAGVAVEGEGRRSMHKENT